MNPSRTGRDGSLSLRFERRLQKTTLVECRFQLPLQVLTPIQQEDGSTYMLLLNPTGGVLGGDRLVTVVAQGAGTHVCFSTPSATRVYRSPGPAAIQETRIRLGPGAVLEYMPDAVIPHRGAALQQSLSIELEAGCVAMFADTLAAGRLAHGERWSFRQVSSEIVIKQGAKPLFIDRALIEPGRIPPARFNVMEDYNYAVTFGVLADGYSAWRDLQGKIESLFAACTQVRGGSSLPASGGIIVRFLAKSAVDVHPVLHQVWGIARSMVLKQGPFILRKY